MLIDYFLVGDTRLNGDGYVRVGVARVANVVVRNLLVPLRIRYLKELV
jgi:hypothetical protein